MGVSGGDRLQHVALPSQCAICMSDFCEAEELKVLPCSELHAFHTKCIQRWLTTHSTCPLCRCECGERQTPAAPPAPDTPEEGRGIMPLDDLSILSGLSQHAMIAQLPRHRLRLHPD